MATSTQAELDNPTPVVIWDQEDGDDADSTKANEEQTDKADDRLSVERDQTDDTRSSTAGSTYAGSHDELLYNQQVLDAIFQHIPIGVVLITAWGTVRGFSKAASRMFLFSSWEVIGENVQLITPGHVAKRHDYYLSRARQRISARLATIMGRHESNIALDNLLIDSPEQQAKVNHDVARITLFGGQKREVIGVDKTGAPFPLEVTVSPLMMKGQLFFLGYLVDIRDLTSFQDLTVKQELLLRSILDSNTMVRILAGERNIKDTFAVVSLAYIEIVDFPQKVVNLNDDNLVATFLSEIFSMFDKAVVSSSAGTKIKTMGSLYLVGTGMPTPTATDAEQLISLCVMMMQSLYGYNSRVKAGQSVEALLHTVANTQRSKKVRIKDSNNWRKKITPVEARVGIHTGHLVAGMFAQLKGSYNVYGTTVVKADRVRKTGKPMHIHITHETYNSLPAQMQASFQARKTELGVFGPLDTYETLVLPPKPAKEGAQQQQQQNA